MMRSEKIALYRTVPSPTFDDWFRAVAWSSIHSTYQGMFDVCAYHEKYCTGDYCTSRTITLQAASRT